MLTMLLGGLWHGAAWTFVVWGGLHGLFLVAHRRFGRPRPAHGEQGLPSWRDLPAIVGTFNLVCLAWIFFRASTFSQASSYLRGIVTLRGGSVDVDGLVLTALALAVVLGIDLAQRRSGVHTPVLNWPPALRGTVYGFLVVAMIVFSGGAPVPFIYFQF
jgi:hypothetical protein